METHSVSVNTRLCFQPCPSVEVAVPIGRLLRLSLEQAEGGGKRVSNARSEQEMALWSCLSHQRFPLFWGCGFA